MPGYSCPSHQQTRDIGGYAVTVTIATAPALDPDDTQTVDVAAIVADDQGADDTETAPAAHQADDRGDDEL